LNTSGFLADVRVEAKTEEELKIEEEEEEEAKMEDRRKGRGGCDSVRRGEPEKMKRRRRAVMLGRF
jgi:hypothetical protein